MLKWLRCLLLVLFPLFATAQEVAKCPGVDGFSRHGNSTRLAVFLHAFSGKGDDLCDAIAVLRSTPQGADTDVYAPDLPFDLFSRARPGDVLADLILRIDGLWAAEGKNYQSMLLVGHSMGSLYARKLYVSALGSTADAPFDPQLVARLQELGAAPLDVPRKWGKATDRIVLLAGINRGWSISHHMSLWRSLTVSGGVVLGRMIAALGFEPFIVMAAQRGAPFITQLRLQWLAMRQRAKENKQAIAKVVQLLGTQDDLVPPGDNLDLVTGGHFSYLEVPHSGHANVIEMNEADPPKNPLQSARAKVFREALQLESSSETSSAAVFAANSSQDLQVDHVVFVMHGIRDEGFWTDKIGFRVATLANAANGSKVVMETSSYGYFPMLSFLVPGARQEKVEWLMDRYTEAKARYPKARFSYVGHSHGTYLLMRALQQHPAVSFHHAVLAGSVIRTDHDWQPLLQAGRIGRVLNLVASNDWVVAWLPNALEKVGVQDVGGAGHYGFSKTATGLIQLQDPLPFVRGGHGAAIAEPWWDLIARFVVDGTLASPPQEAVVKSHGWAVAAGAMFAPLLWLLGLVLLLLPLGLLLRWRTREWKKTVAVIGYLSAIWLIITRY